MTKRSNTSSVNGNPSPQPSSNSTGQTENTGEILPTLLPTPQTRDWKGASGRAYKGEAPDLPSTLMLLPTPTTHEVEHPNMVVTPTGRRATKDGKSSHSIGLMDTVAMLPTPGAQDWKKRGPASRQKGVGEVVNLLPTPSARDWKGAAKGKGRDSMDSVIESGATKHRTGLLSQADSPASRSATLDEEWERKMTAISGLTCLASYETSNPNGSSLKTCVALLLGTKAWYSKPFALTWKAKVTKSNRLLFQLSPSVRHTDEIGSGLLHTPKASDRSEGWDWNGSRTRKQPNNAARIAMLPTPRVSEIEGAPVKNAVMKNGTWSRENAKGVRFGVKVKDVVETLNTPTGIEAGKKLRLQPAMTQWMMGYPDLWTEFPTVEPSGDGTA